jgi:hypothetical protein
MKKPESKVAVVPPWTAVSSADIQSALDSEVAGTLGRRKSKRRISPDSLPSIRESLINVFGDDEELRKEAVAVLEGENPEAVLAPFLKAEPEWLIRCSVTDSMVSGIWGLKGLVLGSRGYLYFHPDFRVGDESGQRLPIVGVWELAGDRSARLACWKDAYTTYCHDFALTPFLGQWAQGPSDFLREAIGAVLKRTPSLWLGVLNRLRQDTAEDDTRGSLIRSLAEKVSSETGMEESTVSGVLSTFLTGSRRPSIKLDFGDLESQVLVAAFVARIGMGGF